MMCVLKCGRTGNAANDARCVRVTWWITRAPDTNSIHIAYYLSTARVVLRTRIGVTLYVHDMSCYVYLTAMKSMCNMLK
jgi:hypothetical protein